jgi:hypothetical protein
MGLSCPRIDPQCGAVSGAQAARNEMISEQRKGGPASGRLRFCRCVTGAESDSERFRRGPLVSEAFGENQLGKSPRHNCRIARPEHDTHRADRL